VALRRAVPRRGYVPEGPPRQSIEASLGGLQEPSPDRRWIAEIQAFLFDQEVNQTGVIPVVNPVIESPWAGDRLEVCPFVLPGGTVWLDVAVGRLRVKAEAKDLGKDFGRLEFPATDQTLIGRAASSRPGKSSSRAPWRRASERLPS